MKEKYRNQKEFPAEAASLEELLEFAEQCLLKRSINAQLTREYRLVIEEAAIKLIQNAPAGSVITVESSRRLNTVHLKLLCPGSPVILEQESEDDIGGKILEEYQDYLNQSYASGINSVDFASSGGFIRKWNVIAILLAVLCAIPIRLLCTSAQIETLTDGWIEPLISFYAGCVQTIAAPVVFFSLTALIVRLHHKFDHDRQLLRTFASYLVSSLVAIAIGYAAAQLNPLNAVTPDLSALRTGTGVTYSSAGEFIETFTFTNLIEAFQIANPIPLLIISILSGIAVSRVLGKEGGWVRKAVLALNSLFSRMLSIVYDGMPVFLFLAILPNLVRDGFYFVFEVFLIVVLFIPLIILQFAVYAIRLRMSGIGPIRFFRDNWDMLKENYRIGSNLQAIPYNRRMLFRRIRMPAAALKERLTLGAMVNMDGNCLIISAFALYMMLACRVPISAGFLIYFAVLLILLSIGAPNQPGSFLVAMVFIMGMLGISTGMYDIVIIAEALLGTAYSFVNSVGDIVTITAEAAQAEKKEKSA